MPRNIRFSIWFSLIILAAFAVGYLAWVKSHETWPFEILAPSLTKEGGGRSSEPDLAGWKTYRNEKYGFEVRYSASNLPGDASIKVTESNNVITFEQITSSGYPAGKGSFSIEVLRDERTKLENYPIPYSRYNAVESKGYLSGLQARVFELPEVCTEACSVPEVYVVAKKADKFYSIHFDYTDKLADIDKQILSTFKFIK